MILLGATAIRDELKEKVGNTIKDLIKADIKFWVLTGDKAEVTIDVVMQAGLISPNTQVIQLRDKDHNKLIDQIDHFLNNQEKTRQMQFRGNTTVNDFNTNDLTIVNSNNPYNTKNSYNPNKTNSKDNNYNINATTYQNQSVIQENENIVENNNHHGMREVNHMLVLDAEILCKMSIKHIRTKIMKVVESCELILCCQLSAK